MKTHCVHIFMALASTTLLDLVGANEKNILEISVYGEQILSTGNRNFDVGDPPWGIPHGSLNGGSPMGIPKVGDPTMGIEG